MDMEDGPKTSATPLDKDIEEGLSARLLGVCVWFRLSSVGCFAFRLSKHERCDYERVVCKERWWEKLTATSNEEEKEEETTRSRRPAISVRHTLTLSKISNITALEASKWESVVYGSIEYQRLQDGGESNSQSALTNVSRTGIILSAVKCGKGYDVFINHHGLRNSESP